MTLELEKIYTDLYPNSEIVSAFGNPLRYLPIGPNDDCLDLGCGGGDMCYRMSALTRGRVVGIDAQPKMIEYAKRNNNKSIEFICDDFMQNGFPDGSFDKIISNATLCHLENKKEVIAEIYRLLKKGGMFCFCDITIRKNMPMKIFNAIESSEWIDILHESPFYDTGGTHFISEEALYRNGQYENMYYSTFLGNK